MDRGGYSGPIYGNGLLLSTVGLVVVVVLPFTGKSPQLVILFLLPFSDIATSRF